MTLDLVFIPRVCDRTALCAWLHELVASDSLRDHGNLIDGLVEEMRENDLNEARAVRKGKYLATCRDVRSGPERGRISSLLRWFAGSIVIDLLVRYEIDARQKRESRDYTASWWQLAL